MQHHQETLEHHREAHTLYSATHEMALRMAMPAAGVSGVRLAARARGAAKLRAVHSRGGVMRARAPLRIQMGPQPDLDSDGTLDFPQVRANPHLRSPTRLTAPPLVLLTQHLGAAPFSQPGCGECSRIPPSLHAPPTVPWAPISLHIVCSKGRAWEVFF